MDATQLKAEEVINPALSKFVHAVAPLLVSRSAVCAFSCLRAHLCEA